MGNQADVNAKRMPERALGAVIIYIANIKAQGMPMSLHVTVKAE